jgi:sarcosine oxidase subunit delta
MLLIRCPWCGDRPEVEFRHAGEAHIARPTDPAALTGAEWASFLYERSNPRGEYRERWRHSHGCGRFFNARRHTLTDRFTATYRPGEEPPA